MSDKEQLLYEIQQTPDELVKEVLNFLLFIRDRVHDSDNVSFLSFIDQINAEMPEEDNSKLPRDFAKNLDHYLYGTPREES
jgi:Mn-containing catalase